MNLIKLVLTDMDGTFLNSSGSFNKELYQDVKKVMQQQGVIFAPVTGKQCERVEELFGEDAEDLWILGDSATRIKHNGEFIYESLLGNKVGLEMIELLESISSDFIIIACTRSGAVIKDTMPADVVRRSYAQIRTVADYKEITEDFVKITVYDAALQCFETYKKLSDFYDSAYIVASEAAWIDIANVNVHKGTTVQHLQQHLNITPEETMAFGDGYNDFELLVRAAFSFAVRNAVPELKDTAKYITGSNDEDAVMKTILALLSLQEGSSASN